MNGDFEFNIDDRALSSSNPLHYSLTKTILYFVLRMDLDNSCTVQDLESFQLEVLQCIFDSDFTSDLEKRFSEKSDLFGFGGLENAVRSIPRHLVARFCDGNSSVCPSNIANIQNGSLSRTNSNAKGTALCTTNLSLLRIENRKKKALNASYKSGLFQFISWAFSSIISGVRYIVLRYFEAQLILLKSLGLGLLGARPSIKEVQSQKHYFLKLLQEQLQEDSTELAQDPKCECISCSQDHSDSINQAESDNSEHNKKVGKQKGIQGDWNSCYLDSLLFSMFYNTFIFDDILRRKEDDSPFTRKTRRILRKEIVANLRTPPFLCSSEKVMLLRQHLSTLNSSLMGSFMDVEEVFYLLLEDVMKEDHFIKYVQKGEIWGDFMHLVIIDPEDPRKWVNLEEILNTSFALNGNLRMKEMPNPAFIVGLPRSDRKLVNYEAVVPTLELDVGNLLESTYKVVECGRKLRLSSIICIQGVHFTAFSYSQEEATWVFFDSMGGNGPEVTEVRDLGTWLNKISKDLSLCESTELPQYVQHAIRNGHWCIYEPINST